MKPVATLALLAGAMACAPTALASDPDDLRKAVNDLAAPHLIKDADVQVKVHQSVLTKIVNKIASIPAANRRITFDGNGRSGHIWETSSGLAGCGGFAEVAIRDGKPALHLVADINRFGAQWQPDGRLALTLELAAEVSGVVHGHIHGPSVPFANCHSTIGGGFGAEKSVSANKGATFDGIVSIAPAPDGGFQYAVSLTSPPQISVTISVEAFRIDRWAPTFGFPVSFDLPKDPIAKGSGLKVLSTSGNTNIAGVRRPYQIDLSDLKLQSAATGVDLRAKATLRVTAPPN